MIKKDFVIKTASARLQTSYCDFNIVVYRDQKDKEHVALTHGELNLSEVDSPWLDSEASIIQAPLVRIQSECLTGEVFHSLKCDCREQLDAAMKKIALARHGVIIYLRQEGRDIGLTNKIKAYDLQNHGLDTIEANEKLGFPPDARGYEIAVAILSDLGLWKIRLMTNSPDKVEQLKALGVEVVERIPLQTEPNEQNKNYLETKKNKLGHWL